MKILATILVFISIALSLVGCSAGRQSVAETTAIIETEKSTVTTPIESEMLIDTEYYTLSVPSSWNDDCFFEVADGESYNYTLSFYDKASHIAINGGWLFSINLLTEFEDYSYYSDYDVLGSLEVYRIGSYNIVVTYPTDVQFSEETSDLYNEMRKDIPDILKTIAFKAECSYSEDPIAIMGNTSEDILAESETKYISRANGIWHHTISRADTITMTIYEEGIFELYYISFGEVQEKIKGIYSIISDDGQYQEFKFVNEWNAQETWIAKIWQTELKDSSGVVYDGLVYIKSENETIYYTGRKW